METVRSSETLVTTCKSIRRYNPEDQHRHLHRRENLKSYDCFPPLVQLQETKKSHKPHSGEIPVIVTNNRPPFFHSLLSLCLLSLHTSLEPSTGQFKKKVTLSHVYNKVNREPKITRCASMVRKGLKVLICYLKNTQCGNPVSHGTRQSHSLFLSRLSPAWPCLWLPQRRWCAVSILEDHLPGMVFLTGGSIPKRVRNSRCTVVTELVFTNCRIQNAFCCGVAILQHRLPWRRWPETLSRVNYKETLRVFLTIVVYRVIVGSLVTSL
jgi:hypothetical protein